MKPSSVAFPSCVCCERADRGTTRVVSCSLLMLSCHCTVSLFVCSSALDPTHRVCQGSSQRKRERFRVNTIGSNRTGFRSCQQVIVFIRPRCSKHMQYLRAFRKVDQCVYVVGKSARRWRRPLTEYCEGSGQGGAEKVSRTICENS